MKNGRIMKNGILVTESFVTPQNFAAEVVDTLSEENLRDIALIYFTEKFSNLNKQELKCEYIRFNGIESEEEYCERLGQY